MTNILTKFCFQGSTMTAILAFYSHPSAQVYTSSLLSKTLSISSGTCQGYPLSPIFFNLIIEPLVESVRTNSLITGFHFDHKSHIINLFAANVILLLTNPTSSLPQAHRILTQFSTVSYYKVNFSKSLILDLGVPPNVKQHLQDHLPFT